jgi:hypothetical protein
MAAGVSAVVEPLSGNGLTIPFWMGYTVGMVETVEREIERELVTREVLEHVLATMLQVINDAYYRAGYLTTEHAILELHKTALEKAILALQREMDDKSEQMR